MPRDTSNKGGNYHGLAFSHKSNRQIQWESFGWELAFYKILERDPFVKEYWSQEVTVGRRTIDFKSEQQDMSVRLYEVKPYSKLLEEKNVEKFAFWHEYCLRKGWEFWIVTDFPPFNTELEVLKDYKIYVLPLATQRDNLDLLDRYAAPCFRSDLLERKAAKLLHEKPVMSIMDLALKLGSRGSGILHHLYNMIYRQLLYADETRKISLNSVVSIKEVAEELIKPNEYRHDEKVLPLIAKCRYYYKLDAI